MKYLLTLLLFVSNGINAIEVYKYLCPNNEKFLECPSVCEKSDDMKIDFKVNINNQVVIANHIWKVKKKWILQASVAFDSCKVVDEKNWVCEDPFKLPDGRVLSISTQFMTEGVYRSKTHYMSNDEIKYYDCAK